MYTIPLLALLALTPPQSMPPSSAVKPESAQVLAQWIRMHPGCRLATEVDCGDQEAIDDLRKGYGGTWKPNPSYQPYYCEGDFNDDGHPDLAVAVIKGSRTKDKFKVLVFNGPFRAGKSAKPAWESKWGDLVGQALFFGSPRPKPWYLLIGPFESDAGGALIANGHSYRWDNTNSDDY